MRFQKYHSQYLLKYFLFFLLSATLVSCSQPQDKEAEVRKLVKFVETSFEEHQGKKIRSIVSENYIDGAGRQKKDIEGLVTFYLLRHKNIHLLTHITQIDFPDNKTSVVTLYAAMAGTSGKFKELLGSLRTDVYKFNFTLQLSKDDWLLQSSEWERASTDDISLLIDSLKE